MTGFYMKCNNRLKCVKQEYLQLGNNPYFDDISRKINRKKALILKIYWRKVTNFFHPINSPRPKFIPKCVLQVGISLTLPVLI